MVHLHSDGWVGCAGADAPAAAGAGAGAEGPDEILTHAALCVAEALPHAGQVAEEGSEYDWSSSGVIVVVVVVIIIVVVAVVGGDGCRRRIVVRVRE